MLLNCGVEETLESPLDCKEIQTVHSEGDQLGVSNSVYLVGNIGTNFLADVNMHVVC